MPKQPRSKRFARVEEREPRLSVAKEATVFHMAFCPLCGECKGMEKVRTGSYVTGHKNWWERTKDFDPQKPFGVIVSSSGRGTFEFVGYFSPEEDTDGFFPLIKARLIQALKEWRDKGWISEGEIRDI